MFDHLLTEEQRRVRDEAREFVKATPRELILDMDAERVHFPKEWLREAAHRRLLGVRHPVRWGGRGLDWVAASAVSEEIGSLSYELACVFGVGADLVCDAILSHGTDAQKERYVAPLLKGELFETPSDDAHQQTPRISLSGARHIDGPRLPRVLRQDRT
jgi:alkylation response protein AidB-like acyl-CoA dehydrogenase